MTKWWILPLLFPAEAFAAPAPIDFSHFDIGAGGSSPLQIFVLLTALSLLPFFLIAVTTFTKNIVVLSFTRQALGLQQTPPNIVLISLAFFLTLFVMSPVLEKSYSLGIGPYLSGKMDISRAASQAWIPLRDFMIRQTRESDLRLVYQLAKAPLPKAIDDITPTRLIPAFMLGELKLGFQIGFVIFLPFLVIDLVVASILMSLGMIMVPPPTISLPIKIMLFLLIDGWGLIAQSLVNSTS